MHVKQLNTPQALQTIPRKSKCVSRRKSFTSLLSWKSDRRRRNCHDLRVIWGHRTVILHIPQIYCNTLLSTNSTASILREEPVLAGLTRTPTEQNITTMGDLIIAMCFQMVCYDSEQQEDYNTRYSISLASEDNQKLYCTVKTLPRPKKLHTHSKYSPFSESSVIVSCCWCVLYARVYHKSPLVLLTVRHRQEEWNVFRLRLS